MADVTTIVPIDFSFEMIISEGEDNGHIKFYASTNH